MCLLLLAVFGALNALFRPVEDERVKALEVRLKFLLRGKFALGQQARIAQSPFQNPQPQTLIALRVGHIQAEHEAQQVKCQPAFQTEQGEKQQRFASFERQLARAVRHPVFDAPTKFLGVPLLK